MDPILLTIGLIYSTIGFALAIFYYYVLKKHFIGNFLGVLIVAVAGSFLGGLISNVFEKQIKYLANFQNLVNIFPPIIASLVLVWIFFNISKNRE